MSATETLLTGILLCHVVIVMYLHFIWNTLLDKFDPRASVNQYGESLTDAIQNSIVRGQRGITTYE